MLNPIQNHDHNPIDVYLEALLYLKFFPLLSLNFATQINSTHCSLYKATWPMAPIKLLKYWTQRKQQGMLFFLKGTLSSLHQHRSNYHHKISVNSVLELEGAEFGAYQIHQNILTKWWHIM